MSCLDRWSHSLVFLPSLPRLEVVRFHFGRPELPQGKTLTQSNSTLLHFDAYVHGLFLDCPALGLHVATSLQVGSSICAQGWECGCWKPTVWAQISLLPQ